MCILGGTISLLSQSDLVHRERLVFLSVWMPANKIPMATVPVDQPKKQIDFILYRPRDRWKVVEVKALDKAVASDQRAISAVLELLPSMIE